MEHAALILALGGPDLVAEALGCHRTQAVRWRTSGIPLARFPAVVELAAKRGVPGVTLDALYAGRVETWRRVEAEPHRKRDASWHARAVDLRAAGHSTAEIAARCGVGQRQVRRVLQRARS